MAKAYVKEFKYPDSKTGQLKERRFLILNEDESRIGGIDLSTVPPEQAVVLIESTKEHDISDFSRKPKDPSAPARTYIGVYKAFSKSKIINS